MVRRSVAPEYGDEEPRREVRDAEGDRGLVLALVAGGDGGRRGDAHDPAAGQFANNSEINGLRELILESQAWLGWMKTVASPTALSM